MLRPIRPRNLVGNSLGILALAGLFALVTACEQGGRQSTTPTPLAEASQPTATARVETEAVPSPTPPPDSHCQYGNSRDGRARSHADQHGHSDLSRDAGIRSEAERHAVGNRPPLWSHNE